MIVLFFLIIDLSFLVPAVIAQNVNPTSELLTSIEMPTNEVNAEIETQPLTVETETKKCRKQFRAIHSFLCFSLIKSLCFISSNR